MKTDSTDTQEEPPRQSQQLPLSTDITSTVNHSINHNNNPHHHHHHQQQMDDIAAVNLAWSNSLAPSYDQDYHTTATKNTNNNDHGEEESSSAATSHNNHHHTHNNNNNTPKEDSPLDCWRTTGGTPMTSRPHILKGSTSYEQLLLQRQQQDESFPMKRVRSRSLGSSSNYDTTTNTTVPAHSTYNHYHHQLLSSWTTEQCHVLATPQRSAAATKHHRQQILLRQQQLQRQQENDDDDDEDPEQPAASHLHGPPLLRKTNTYTTPPLQQQQQQAYNSTPVATPPATPQSTRGGRPINHPSPTTDIMASSTPSTTNPLWISILYGLINATIVLPVLMSFASIIYREQVFQPYMPVLIKLTVVSGIVHQICFSTFSGLPFAVGQVQDAGLIFLSSMATTIAQHCQQQQQQQQSNNNNNEIINSDAALLATVTVCLSLSTAVLGLGLMLIGQGGLAQYVQLLPTSVVGGYLAFIGWFCGMAGVGLMAGQSSDVVEMIHTGSWVFVLPGVLGGCLIYGAVRWLRHMAVLPVSILTLLGLFYAVVWMTGSSITQVTEQGWIRAMDQEPHWTSTWDYLRLDLVDWSVLPKLVLTELSMIFVVAMSSSLDVAAIELELQRPLDYNGELKMVGLSNLVSGLTGGYTGSYIFSQSIFSLRAGITSRAAGYVLAAAQAVFFALPFPIMAYIPNFFFGSLLSMICVDLLYEWLWDVRHKVTPVEYMVCLVTFAAIQVVGVEFGILLGLVVYLICERVGLRVGAEAPASTKTDESDEGTPDGLLAKEETTPLLGESQSYGTR